MNMQQRKKAFTLIELLVVVSIIALLVSILMPALNKARDQAKKTVCSSNLRSLTMAMIYYCDDNNGRTPCATNIWYQDDGDIAGWCGVTYDDANRQLFPVHEQIYGYPDDKTTGLKRGLLWKYVNSIDMWRCPADPLKDQLRSYCMSAQWWNCHVSEDGSVWYAPGTADLIRYNIDRIKRPSERFTFNDQIGLNLDAYFAIMYEQPVWWNIPNHKHSGSSVNGFADGHVESYKLQKETIKLVERSYNTCMSNGYTAYRMYPEEMPNEDMIYYQRATWGKLGW